MNLTIENEIRTVASKSKEATYQKNVLMLQTYADLSGSRQVIQALGQEVCNAKPRPFSSITISI